MKETRACTRARAPAAASALYQRRTEREARLLQEARPPRAATADGRRKPNFLVLPSAVGELGQKSFKANQVQFWGPSGCNREEKALPRTKCVKWCPGELSDLHFRFLTSLLENDKGRWEDLGRIPADGTREVGDYTCVVALITCGEAMQVNGSCLSCSSNKVIFLLTNVA